MGLATGACQVAGLWSLDDTVQPTGLPGVLAGNCARNPGPGQYRFDHQTIAVIGRCMTWLHVVHIRESTVRSSRSTNHLPILEMRYSSRYASKARQIMPQRLLRPLLRLCFPFFSPAISHSIICSSALRWAKGGGRRAAKASHGLPRC